MITMSKRAYFSKPKDYRSIIDGKHYLMMLDKQTGGTVLAPVMLKNNPTLTTIKSFIRKNPDLYINCQSSFDGMVDCVMPCDNQGFAPVQPDTNNSTHTLGIKGAWFVLGSSDYFTEYEDEQFTGYEVYNCCGKFILAIKKAV